LRFYSAEAASSTQTPSAESASKTSADKKPTKDASKTKPKPKSKPKAKDKAPRPPKTPDSEVINISQLNIKEIFSTKKADVFMVFHAPSCGLCKRLKPEFRKVSNAFKDVSSEITWYALLLCAAGTLLFCLIEVTYV
jgi:thiol-disulfide isomerase/thioredoxin